MTYPSEAMREWCRRIRRPLDGPRQCKVGSDDGLCQHDWNVALKAEPQERQAKFVGALFWAVWIDQVMWHVLVEGRGQGCAANRELYEEFIRRYPFPKLYSSIDRGHARPFCFVPAYFVPAHCDYQTPDRELLLELKRTFWGEVAFWLGSIGRPDVTDAAVSAFKEDLRLQFPQELSFLFEE
jgi:hypothetical protein